MTYPLTKRQEAKQAIVCFDGGVFVMGDTCKDQAKKILEEAAEVYAALEQYSYMLDRDNISNVIEEIYKQNIIDECADVIQAAMNMAYAIGYDVHDIEHAMERCAKRNADRGRMPYDPVRDKEWF